MVSTPSTTALVAWWASSLATRVTRAIGESPRGVRLLLFFLGAVAFEPLRAVRVAAPPGAAAADLLAGRFDREGPLAVERAPADFALRVAVRAGLLVPAGLLFVLLRDLDFLARAAMTLSSRG